MNLQQQSFNCPIINGRYPANCEEMQSFLIDMYMNGEITDNDPEHVYQRNLQKCKDKLLELGRDDKYADYVRNAYYDTYGKKEDKDALTDEEEREILEHYQKFKSKK